jgi:ribosomal protein L16 Arg81 hydroxylase
MKYNFLKEQDFLEHKQADECYLFKDIQGPLPSWNDIIVNLNISIENNWLVKCLDGLGFVTHNADLIPQVRDLLNYISSLDKDAPSSAHCYFSLSNQASTFGRHKDSSDVFFWQVIGKTEWIVETKKETITYNLEPNNLLFVPRGIWHTTKPLTPRAGISFGLDY